MILRQGMTLACEEILLGPAGGGAFTRLMASQLFHVNACDPSTLLAVVDLLLCAALAACLFTALKATWAQPMDALRAD